MGCFAHTYILITTISLRCVLRLALSFCTCSSGVISSNDNSKEIALPAHLHYVCSFERDPQWRSHLRVKVV